ncbi:DUF3599 family protein [Bacillus altitudinis]|uniref:DUF3599 family protein n=1 Tax=Bacillus altitudinis TaxID=293387 RepID=UPI00228251DD|nr:DUF3599 family protein [Bacillus altitudinis]MCY7498239.1 YqbH/XkdH family protein [Bacillus altitudinis]MCY7535456.1 YqbH/XkdH family protein [Bacillus altitudinis]MCY7545473.1 YqbH/XkdH family protein [Bacillus altitudinis]MCY7553573.1 YqbH/XkdH family protein [Bacillus altitudinis]MCY7592191.1 YqbH/XkdH family protein [Bacillus altitudinis]
MSYQSLLTDRCDIYHLQEEQAAGNHYGIPVQDAQPVFSYPDEPDQVDQACYFTERNQNITQQEPNATIHQSYLVHFPINADVRLNDKVVWEGVTLKLQKPRKIKNHHIEVVAMRSESL